MYVPRPNAVDDDAAVRAMVADVGTATFVTTGDDGWPLATLLPIVWTGDRVVAHLAIANPHWREIGDDTPCLLVVDRSAAYVSPRWYASKAEHGRVVPTWNYESVQLRGLARVHTDPAWLLQAVTSLTQVHEGRADEPWHVDDAPPAFVTGQLRGIVGLEVRVERVEAKSKMSQNRSTADRAGVVAGLDGTGAARDRAVADVMRPVLPEPDTQPDAGLSR